MSAFSSRALQVLNGIYDFKFGGRTAPEDVDLGPIQMVHDVHREAELGVLSLAYQAQGYFHSTQDNVHGAADTQTNDFSPYTITSAAGAYETGSSLRVWCWITQIGVSANATGILTNAMLTLNYGGLGQLTAQAQLLARFNAYTEITTAALDFVAYNGVTAGANAVMGPNAVVSRLPILVPAGGSVNFISTAAAAGTIRANLLIWAGPIGVYPPGIA